MFVRYGLGDELQDRITQYQRALHDLNVSIQIAERSGQQAAADQLRNQVVALTQVINDLIRQKRNRDNPSILGIALAKDERLLQAQRDVRQAARDIVAARQHGQDTAAAKKDFTKAAATYTQQVSATREREMPSSFSLGLADLGASFAKILPLLALGVGAALVLPVVLPRRGR